MALTSNPAGKHVSNRSASTKSMAKMCVAYAVSDHIFLEVFDWLPPLGLLRCQQVCSRFYTLARHNTLWRRALLFAVPASAIPREHRTNKRLKRMHGVMQQRFYCIVTYKLRKMQLQMRKHQRRSTRLLAGWTATIVAAPATLASIAAISHRFSSMHSDCCGHLHVLSWFCLCVCMNLSGISPRWMCVRVCVCSRFSVFLACCGVPVRLGFLLFTRALRI